MDDFERYTFTKEEFKQLTKLINKIYKLTIIADFYCSSQNEIEELSYLIPIMNYIRYLSDNLNCIFIEYPAKDCIKNFRNI